MFEKQRHPQAEIGDYTALQVTPATKSNMQMCRKCTECTMKNSKITSFFSHFIYSGGNIAWVTGGDRKTGFFGPFLLKNADTTFNICM
jgi:hypothetical protein